MIEWNGELLRRSIKLWLEEDIGSGDVTTMTTIPLDQRSRGIIHVKEDGIIAGLPVARAVFAEVDAALIFEPPLGECHQRL